MIVLGFLLLVVCIVAVVIAIYTGGKQAQFDLGIVDVDVQSSSWFFAGMVVTLVGLIGLGMMKRGLRKSRENRRELKQLEKMRSELDRRDRAEADKDVKDADAPTPGSTTS